MYDKLKDLILDLKNHYPNGKGAEIGVFKGETSKAVLNNWDGTLYMIDVWKSLDWEGYEDSTNHSIHPTAYKETMDNIQGLEDKGIMIRATSKQASNLIADNSLDWIFIDANHSYDYVKEDLELWWPKLKKGGLFSGHDYMGMDWYSDPKFAPNGKDKYIYTNTFDGKTVYNGVFGVNPAVDEFCEKMNYDFKVTNEWFGTWYFTK
jgi:hypothetical protein